jgi:hypothetical protein
LDLAVILIVVTVESVDLSLLNFVRRLHTYPQIFRRHCFYDWKQCEYLSLRPAVITNKESVRNVLLLIVSSRRAEFIFFFSLSQTPQKISSENMGKKH